MIFTITFRYLNEFLRDMGEIVGFFKKASVALKKANDLTAPDYWTKGGSDAVKRKKRDPNYVDPEDLTLPEEIPTDVPELTLKKCQGRERVDIDIVGESFRSFNVEAVARAAEGQQFDIYLVAEPTNQYDKNAVAVYVATKHVGYIAKPANKKWFQWVNEATARGELLWGRGKAIRKQGTKNTGIFGHIYIPRQGKDIQDLIPKKLTPSELSRAAGRVIDLSNIAGHPHTVSELKSLAKKGVTTVTPIAAHALWVSANPDGQEVEKWDEIYGLCDDLLDTAAEAAYASDPSDVDMLGPIESLALELQEFL